MTVAMVNPRHAELKALEVDLAGNDNREADPVAEQAA